MRETNSYIPYEATSLAEIEARRLELQEFVRSRFPGASKADLDAFEEYLVGVHHDGITTGLGLNSEDPVGPLEAYKYGYNEAINDVNQLGGSK